MWEQANGPIPSGLMVLHRCDNPPCFRYDHLRLGTHSDNVDDRQTRGRNVNPLGDHHGQTKISDADVAELRKAWMTGLFTKTALGARFGISRRQAGDIINGKYRHL